MACYNDRGKKSLMRKLAPDYLCHPKFNVTASLFQICWAGWAVQLLKMKLAIACASLALLLPTNAINPRTHMPSEPQHEVSTFISEDCCLAQGGNLCGKVWKDCCSGKCQESWLSIWCKDNEKLERKCDNSCANICKSKGGVVCDFDYSSGDRIKCCPQASCQGTFSKSCAPNSEIDIGKCVKNSRTELAAEKYGG